MSLIQVAHYLRVEAGISAVLLVFALSACLGIPLPPDVLALTFFGAWALYILDAEVDVSPEDRLGHSARYDFFSQNQASLKAFRTYLLGVCVLLACLEPTAFWRVKWQMLLVILVGVFYVRPAFPWISSKPKLKKATALKTLIIPFIWLVAGLGIVRAFGPDFLEFLSLAGSWSDIFFVFLLLDTIALDIVDKSADSATGVKTFVTEWPRFTFGLVLVLLVLFAARSMDAFGTGTGIALTGILAIQQIAAYRWKLARSFIQVCRVGWLLLVIWNKP